MNYEWAILHATRIGEEFTTQSLVESMFGCKKGEHDYRQNVDQVAKDLQMLAKKGHLSKERIPSGKGYMIIKWRRIL